jgi:hypothetical protein
LRFGRFSGHGRPPWSSRNYRPGISFCYWTAAGYKLRRINITLRSFLCLFTTHCEFLALQTWCTTWGVHKMGRPSCHPPGAQKFEVAPGYLENLCTAAPHNTNLSSYFRSFVGKCWNTKPEQVLQIFKFSRLVFWKWW